jgi:hypothetical protein
LKDLGLGKPAEFSDKHSIEERVASMSIEDIQNSRFEKTEQDFKSRDREGAEE